MAKNAAQQRIEFNFFTLDTLTGGHLLGDMAINRSAEARRSRERLLNTVAEFLQSHFEDAEEYEEVKVSPASNGDDSAVVTLFQGRKLTEYQMDELVTEMTHDALAYWEENPDATPFYDEEEDDEDDREENPAGKHAFRRGIEIDIGAAQSLLMDHGHYDLAMKVRQLKEFRKTEDLQRFALLIKAHLLSNNHEIGLPKKAIKLREMRDKVVGTLDFQGEQKRTSLYEQTRNEEIASWLRHSVTGAAQQFFGRGRSDNPGKSGLSLYWTAVGAAVGAAVVHFKMKPKQ